MKKLFSLFIMVFIAVLTACSTEINKMQGVYITEDYNTNMGDSVCKVTYTFVGDSLYIDTYPSGCFVTAMSLEYLTHSKDNPKYNCNATETIFDIENNISYKKIYHLSFIKCEWDKYSFAVYRDGVVVDIIKPLTMSNFPSNYLVDSK